MRRILVVASAIVLVLLVGGFLAIGAFPPKAPVHPVHATIPADKLSPA